MMKKISLFLLSLSFVSPYLATHAAAEISKCVVPAFFVFHRLSDLTGGAGKEDSLVAVDCSARMDKVARIFSSGRCFVSRIVGDGESLHYIAGWRFPMEGIESISFVGDKCVAVANANKIKLWYFSEKSPDLFSITFPSIIKMLSLKRSDSSLITFCGTQLHKHKISPPSAASKSKPKISSTRIVSPAHSGHITTATLHGDLSIWGTTSGRIYIGGFLSSDMKVLDVRGKLEGVTNCKLHCLACTDDGSYMVAGGEADRGEGLLVCFKRTEERGFTTDRDDCIVFDTEGCDAIHDISIASDATCIVSTSARGHVKLWDMEGTHLLKTSTLVLGKQKRFLHTQFSTDSRRLICISQDRFCFFELSKDFSQTPVEFLEEEKEKTSFSQKRGIAGTMRQRKPRGLHPHPHSLVSSSHS